MATVKERAASLRRFVAPGAAGVAGAAAGLYLTKNSSGSKRLRELVPGFEGIGDITDDLRDRLDSVLGKADVEGSESPRPQRDAAVRDQKELAARRRERQQRRDKRRKSTKA